MYVFNSLGSNYDLATVMATLLIDNGRAHHGELLDYLEKRYGGEVVLTYKGREAILIGLKLLQLPAKSQVVVTGFTCLAVEQAIKKAGLVPVFLDVDESLNFTPAKLQKALREHKKIRAVLAQNTLGQPAQIKEIKALCQKHKLYLFEDLAHSIGAKYDRKTEAGTVGDLVALSFSQDKTIDGVSGGALIVRSRELRRKPLKEALTLSDIAPWYQVRDRIYPLLTGLIRLSYRIYLGKVLHRGAKLLHLLSNPMKYRGGDFNALPNWQAGLAMNGYIDLEAMMAHRQKIAQAYQETINPSLVLRKQAENVTWLRFPIVVPENKRDGLLEFLRAQGFFLRDIWYDVPVAPRQLSGQSSYRKGTCPRAEEYCSQIVNLPTHRSIMPLQASRLAELVNSYLAMSAKELDNLAK